MKFFCTILIGLMLFACISVANAESACTSEQDIVLANGVMIDMVEYIKEGDFRPRIYLPYELADDELESIALPQDDSLMTAASSKLIKNRKPDASWYVLVWITNNKGSLISDDFEDERYVRLNIGRKNNLDSFDSFFNFNEAYGELFPELKSLGCGLNIFK